MLPQLRELRRSFPDELVVIGVHSAKFPAERVSANLRAASRRLDIDHPVINDAEMAVWQSYAVRAWPTLMFVDPEGKVWGKHEGEFPLDPIRDLLRDAITSYDAAGLIDRTPLPVEIPAESPTSLRFPENVLADEPGGRLFVADTGHHRIVVAGLDGRVQTTIGAGIAGWTDGPATDARFDRPQGMALAPDRATLYIADAGSHTIRAIDLSIELAAGSADHGPPESGGVGDGWTVRTVAGTGELGHDRQGGPALETGIASPWDLTFRNGVLWIAMAGTHQLWTFDPATSEFRAAAGTGVESIHDGPLAEATFAQPYGVSELDGILYVADSETSAIRSVDPAGNRVRRLLGRGLFDFGDRDGAGDEARMQHTQGVCATTEDGRPIVYIVDGYNGKIKRLDVFSRTVTTLAGAGGDNQPHLADGPFDAARFWEPGGITIAGRTLYVADTNNHAIRALDLERQLVTTLPIGGSPA